MEPSIILPMSTFAGLSADARHEIMQAILPGQTGVAIGEGHVSEQCPHEEGPAELTNAMVRKLTAGLGTKTTKALRVIASSPASGFKMSDVIEVIEDAETYLDIRAVWAALTRRTRKILGEGDADLVWWSDEDDEGDWTGRVSPLTHASLKAYFGLKS